MKTIILTFVLSIISLFGYSQKSYQVNVAGTVTMKGDNTPMPYFPVMIVTDSLDGEGYYNMVLTDVNGSYSDTFTVDDDNAAGTVYVSVMNCNGGLTKQADFEVNSHDVIIDFEICSDSMDFGDTTCFAMFDYSTGDDPLSVQFFNVSQGNPTSFEWQFGDGTTSSEENPVHVYSQEGLYSVNFTISGNECSSSMTMDIFVGTMPGDSTDYDCQAMFVPLPVDTNSMAIQFLDESISFDGNTPESWKWDFGDGSTSTEQNPLHVYANTGVYTVCLSIATTDSSCSSSVCIDIYVSPDGEDGCSAYFYYMPLDSIGIDMTNLQFIDWSDGNPAYWSWDFGDGTSSTEQNPVHQYTEQGTYDVCLTIFNNDSSCQNTFCETVYAVSDSTGGDMGFFTAIPDLNDPFTISFEVVDFSNCEMEYTWDFGDNTTGSGPQISHTYQNSGLYTVTVLATATDGDCSWSFTGEIWAGDELMVKVEGNVYLDSSIQADQGVVYLITFDTTGMELSKIDTAVIEENGHYEFETNFLDHFIFFAQAELTNGSAYYGDYVPTYHLSALSWEDAYPIIPIIPDMSYDIFMIPQESMAAGEGEINGTVHYEGKDPAIEGVEILLMDAQQNVLDYVKTDENGIFKFPQLGYGNYKLKAELVGHNSNIEDIAITEENPTQEISVVITEGEVILGIRKKQPGYDMMISSLYPNPVENSFFMSFTSKEEDVLTLKVINQTGQVIYTKNINAVKGNNRISADVSHLPQGVYIVKLKNHEGMILNTQKMIKLR
jgi:PKD repeat protein